MSAVWAEITDRDPSEARAAALEEALKAQGVDNRRLMKTARAQDLRAAVDEARAEGAANIRFAGTLPEAVPALYETLPSQMLSLRCADALVFDKEGRAWPRNFHAEGFTRMIAADLKDLDLGAAAFVIGATSKARSCVAAISRAGFKRINLTDTDEARGMKLLEEFRRAYFNVQFQFTRRHMITHLPGVHSIAVNTIRVKDDPNHLNELFYFNFLKTGGVWVEATLGADNAALLAEARSAGAQVEPGEQLAAYADRAWVEACFGKRIDFVSYRDELVKRLGTSSSS